MSPPLSSSHGQGQGTVVVPNEKQQAPDLAVGYRIAAILRSMFKDLGKGVPLLPRKKERLSPAASPLHSCQQQQAEMSSPRKGGEQGNYEYPKPLQVPHISAP